MDSDELRTILFRSRTSIWSLIQTAIKLAAADEPNELLSRRDKIVETLYTPVQPRCGNCNETGPNVVVDQHPPYYPEYIIKGTDDVIHDDDNDNKEVNIGNEKSPLSENEEEEEGGLDPFSNLFGDDDNDVLTTVLNVKEQLDDSNLSDDAVFDLLQTLADIDITYETLEETDIGRHVNRLRKHESNEVRALVKQLVKKWKEIVDDWVRVNPPKGSSNIVADEDSPQENMSKVQQQTGHIQVHEFGYSPSLQNGSSSTERNYREQQTKAKAPQSVSQLQTPSRPPKSVPKASSVPPNRALKEPVTDDERLNSARKRLQENYKEAQNAKKQKKIQVMDIHEIPRPRNGFFAKNRGGFQGRR